MGSVKQELAEYRAEVSRISKKKYELPRHMERYRLMRGSRRIAEKRKARHLRVVYSLFAKRRDLNQAYEKYSRKKLAENLTKRGERWKRINLSLLGSNLLDKQSVIRDEFEQRIAGALEQSEKKKEMKKKESRR